VIRISIGLSLSEAAWAASAKSGGIPAPASGLFESDLRFDHVTLAQQTKTAINNVREAL
jgi:hypothetical protein